MSGHSKWATTKRQKAVIDAKRSSLFTKISKNISIAARDGADPSMNFKLRMAIDQAKEASMPKDNIERAIARGTGTGGVAQLERVLYEGYGPAGIAVLIEAISDNKNRTFSEVKHYFSKNGGHLGSTNSVAWMFDLRGVVHVAESALSETQQLALIDAGMTDFTSSGEGTEIVVPLEKLQTVRDASEKLGLTIRQANATYLPKEHLPVADEASVLSFLTGLDDLDDVDVIHTNADI